ncbi:hypothetical protein [Priestia aryabhattai]
MIYTVRGLYWSLLGECKIDEKVLGLAIGVVSFIGYLPDILMPLVNIELFKTLGPNGGITDILFSVPARLFLQSS